MPAIPKEQLRQHLLMCLINNQMVDAALSAMSYTLLGATAAAKPALRDPTRYVVSEGQDDTRINTMTLTTAFTLDELLNHTDQFIKLLGNWWDGTLCASQFKVMWDTMRISLVPCGDDKYAIRTIYLAVPTPRDIVVHEPDPEAK